MDRIDEQDQELERLEALCRGRAEIIEGVVRVLDGQEWDSQSGAMIADILTNAGYAIREPDEEADEDTRRYAEPPTESEVKLLAYAYADTCLVAEDSEDRDNAIKDEVQGAGGGLEQVQSAYIAVFRNYITGGPGYMGTVYLVLWDGAPEFVSVAFWERTPRRLKMIHYGNV